MNGTRCLLRVQNLWVLSTSAHQYAALLQSMPAAVLPKAPVQYDTHRKALRHFHGGPAHPQGPGPPGDSEGRRDVGDGRSVVTQDDLFERVARDAKTKATFSKVVDVFLKRDKRRRGHVEFIYAALKKMPEFGVERDLAVYNKLLDVFPKEVFVPRNYIQRMFNHYPRQQECGVQLLEQMETYGIMPNVETKVLLVQIFGEKGHPMRKYQRLMYWFPKFKHLNPFPVPRQLTTDPVDLARFSLARIAGDLDAKATVFQMPYTDITESGEEITVPYIVGIQSPDQMELLAKHNPSKPVFMEGPFPLWLRTTCVYYYILRADPLPPEEKMEEPYDPERCFDYPLQLNLELERDLGDEEDFDVDRVDEGPVFAMCMTSQGDQATLNQWLSGLQQSNPMLGRVPTLFRLDAGPRELQRSDGGGSRPGRETPEPEPEPEPEREVSVDIEEERRQSRGMKQ